MDVRSQIVRDCTLLGDFAVKSVETMKAGDEKGVFVAARAPRLRYPHWA